MSSLETSQSNKSLQRTGDSIGFFPFGVLPPVPRRSSLAFGVHPTKDSQGCSGVNHLKQTCGHLSQIVLQFPHDKKLQA